MPLGGSDKPGTCRDGWVQIMDEPAKFQRKIPNHLKVMMFFYMTPILCDMEIVGMDGDQTRIILQSY